MKQSSGFRNQQKVINYVVTSNRQITKQTFKTLFLTLCQNHYCDLRNDYESNAVSCTCTSFQFKTKINKNKKLNSTARKTISVKSYSVCTGHRCRPSYGISIYMFVYLNPAQIKFQRQPQELRNEIDSKNSYNNVLSKPAIIFFVLIKMDQFK
jgi:hypothetical protein